MELTVFLMENFVNLREDMSAHDVAAFCLYLFFFHLTSLVPALYAHISKSIITALAAKPPVSVISVSTSLVSLKFFDLGLGEDNNFCFRADFSRLTCWWLVLCCAFPFPFLNSGLVCMSTVYAYIM